MTAFADLRVYNTLTGRVEKFVPLYGKRVFMFVCGPTVYDYSHIGHGRVFTFFDTVARYLRWAGYSLFYLVNITDVDDKIINRAKEEGMHPLKLARKYESFYYEDMESLNVTSVNLYARASDYLPEIWDQIRVLLEKGHAYETETGVYFDITTFPDYGKLSKQKIEELRVHRIEPDPTKRNPGDFALWRKRPKDEFGWESPWGYGRPGWHIEDTAITIKHFGKQYDIHGGAIELAFPHHEAEIAQAESYTGVKPFVKYWIHIGLLTIKGEKMSKSLGNIIRIRDVVQEYGPEPVRLLLISSFYRSPMDFRWELLDQARSSYQRIKTAYDNLYDLEVNSEVGNAEVELLNKVKDLRDRFFRSLADNFNTPEALANLYELIRLTNAYVSEVGEISEQGKGILLSTFNEMLSVLGIRVERAVDSVMLKSLVQLLLEVRSQLRQRRMYELSDEIRGRLRDLGIELQDTPQGTKWRIIR